jgi:hypothetical protein
VLDSFTSLAPILDFAVQDMDRAGQGQLVMCCGTLRDGSLRAVRNGIGLNELNCVELAGIRGVWALRPGWRDAYDRLLVMAFVGETRVSRARGRGAPIPAPDPVGVLAWLHGWQVYPYRLLNYAVVEGCSPGGLQC